MIKFRPRDFIQTTDDLVFSAVSYSHTGDKIPGFLRYVPCAGGFKKVDTRQANKALKEHPEYLPPRGESEIPYHLVPVGRIKRIFYPKKRVLEIMNNAADDLEIKARRLIKIFSKEIPIEKIGVTGSILIGVHRPDSDIDLVIYGRKNFMLARDLLKKLIRGGIIDQLDEKEWEGAYRKRVGNKDPDYYTFEEFLQHEKRKFNKGVISGTKFDILMVLDDDEEDKAGKEKGWRKIGKIKLQGVVEDDSYAFSYPARYGIWSIEGIRELISFTHTYMGQAENGEKIEVSGVLEEDEEGSRRVIVGTTREAVGEYIKVLEV